MVNKSSKCEKIIVGAKESHIKEISKPINNFEKAPKAYWNILNCFSNNEKIHFIPSLLVNGEIISNSSRKSENLKIFLHRNAHLYLTQVSRRL